MRNLKKQLREKLRQEKREKLELRRELHTLDKDSDRALEIRKLLGIATLKDLLGDKYPKRICRHCGKKAYDSVDLLEFSSNSGSKHSRDNCCKSCASIINLQPLVTIVGPYSNLPKQSKCDICGRIDSGTGIRSWFLTSASVCKHCLGTHEEMFGYPLKLRQPIPLAYKGIPFTSYIELGELLGIPSRKARYLLITNQLKDITWTT